ncbi:MAG: tRNA (adenosine(37)-N6)-threonylcarbamoyltransferase complex transferase subunit TsaD [Schleiferiaceae bacterium]|nr:tRNA (adenosine(37)-N6)-threonylcarbamoyltransferase complex transferase subunit TsaD [Schleiferiaceae bacterium]MDO7686730.1 tRNA (adenosine(37)-N6)-threonylcarbamoyltransferase complex transferase subunit TsaD [Schleiferiaceae bacterium]
MKKGQLTLAIESSCDDTAAAVLHGLEVKSNVRHSQLDHHAFGGVVPEIASRKHGQLISAVVNQALIDAQVDKTDLTAIAVTQGPGLLGSLLVGHSFAKSMALALNLPLINVHHMKAHILAHFLVEDGVQPRSSISFPFLCLTVSGGHSQIVRVDDWNAFTILGETLDDAVGEAFDKAAKLLSLPYPGGPEIDTLAQQGKARFKFATVKIPGLDMSFSGLKTSFIQVMQRHQQLHPNTLIDDLPDWCASIQKALISPLIQRTTMAMKQEGLRDIAIAGGVAANSHLRSLLTDVAKHSGWSLHLPPLSYTSDNAAMVGAAAHFALQNDQIDHVSSSAKARIPIDA